MKEIALFPIFKTLNRKKIWNFIKTELSLVFSKILKKTVIWGKPYILTIEPSSICNLRCPLCAVGAGRLSRTQGFLDLSIYQNVLDDLGDTLIELLLFNQGEPFLHPQLLEMVKFAQAKRIYTTISTNGYFLDDETQLKALVKSGLNVLIVSLDGASEVTYQKYRQNGDFHKVVNGLRKLQQMKQKQAASVPQVFIQFLVMQHNEHEMDEIRRLGAEVGAARVLYKSLQVEQAHEAEKYLPETSGFRRYFFENGRMKLKRAKEITCQRLWRSSVVLSDGSVVGCCFDKDAQYILGNLTETNFSQIWHASKYERFRNRSLQKRTISHLCANCTEGVKIYY